MNCLNCGKEVKKTLGKREKHFCDSNCRATHWQKMKAFWKRQKKEIIEPKIDEEKIETPKETPLTEIQQMIADQKKIITKNHK